MFHWVRGIPFDFNSGAYDNLNMWEQIDNGDQYTPAKKYLLAVPIVLFLVSTHYTHYDLSFFLINLLATVAVIIPKLPAVCFPHLVTCLTLVDTNHTTVAPITDEISLRCPRGSVRPPRERNRPTQKYIPKDSTLFGVILAFFAHCPRRWEGVVAGCFHSLR
jgi:hypothetical protein